MVLPGGEAPDGCASVAFDLGTDGSPPVSQAVDMVVHLAQSPAYRQFPGGVADMTAVNVLSTVRLLEWARITGAQAFILASTGSVHGAASGPFREDGPTLPTSFYGASKLAAEALCQPYADLMRIAVLRLWCPYGPEQSDKLIPNLVKRVAMGEVVTLDGPDGLVMTPTHVDDVVRCFDQSCQDPRWRGIINISAPVPVSIREVAERAGEVLGMAPVFQSSGRPPPPPLVPDLERLRSLVDVESFVPLAVGLRDMAGGYQPVAFGTSFKLDMSGQHQKTPT